MCGNGVRMVARKLKMEGAIQGDTVVLDTEAGEIVPTHRSTATGCTVDMGIARFGGEKLACFTATPSTSAAASPAAATRSPSSTSATRTRSSSRPWPLELVPLHEVGPVIETHKYFPRKANVEFVKVARRAQREDPRLGARRGGDPRLWHRRHGHRRRTGAHRARAGARSPWSFRAAGSLVDVKPDWRVFMTGPAEEIYHGDLSLEFLAHLEHSRTADLSRTPYVSGVP